MSIKLPYAYLPENYQFFEKLQEDENEMPKGTVIFGILVDQTKAILATREVDPSTSMDFENPHGVVIYLHDHMEDNEGLVEVGCGKTRENNSVIYNILKRRMYADDRPGVMYFIHLNLKIQEHVYFIHGVFEEYGTTGIRESGVYAMYMKDHPDAEFPPEGWFRDPYDANFTKGFLRSFAEHHQFDRFCPGHPLSQARAYIDYILDNN